MFSFDLPKKRQDIDVGGFKAWLTANGATIHEDNNPDIVVSYEGGGRLAPMFGRNTLFIQADGEDVVRATRIAALHYNRFLSEGEVK
jgi:hypothetical protein